MKVKFKCPDCGEKHYVYTDGIKNARHIKLWKDISCNKCRIEYIKNILIERYKNK